MTPTPRSTRRVSALIRLLRDGLAIKSTCDISRGWDQCALLCLDVLKGAKPKRKAIPRKVAGGSR